MIGTAGQLLWRARNEPRVLLEPIPCLGCALCHAGLEHPVAILDGVVDGRGSQRGLAVVLLEGQGLDRDMAGPAFALERPHDALGPHDLPELAAEAVLFRPVGSLVHDPPRAAGRKSISQLATSYLRGPHQLHMCSHELCASNTSSRGASKTRVMTISRSDGVVT